MFGRLTQIEQLKAIEGIASDVRQARTTIISSGGWAESSECLFRLSGTPVALRVSNAIFIENGETVRVVGSFNRNGVFEASAYYNRSSGVSGKSTLALHQMLGVAGIAAVAVGGIVYFWAILLPPDRLAWVIIGLAGLIFARIVWEPFVRWSKVRTIDRLLNDA